jgi:hypothetical protein
MQVPTPVLAADNMIDILRWGWKEEHQKRGGNLSEMFIFL